MATLATVTPAQLADAYQVWSGSLAAGTFTVTHVLTCGAALDFAKDEYMRPHKPDVLVRRADGSLLLSLTA
jgi:hypothetical protein